MTRRSLLLQLLDLGAVTAGVALTGVMPSACWRSGVAEIERHADQIIAVMASRCWGVRKPERPGASG
jgi:hypothetical protein